MDGKTINQFKYSQVLFIFFIQMNVNLSQVLQRSNVQFLGATTLFFTPFIRDVLVWYTTMKMNHPEDVNRFLYQVLVGTGVKIQYAQAHENW